MAKVNRTIELSINGSGYITRPYLVKRCMLKKFISFALSLHLILLSSVILAEHPKNFQEAKKYARIIWSSNPETIYCGCKYDNQLNVDHQSCGYEPRDSKRANKIEWEHLVPASWFGRQRECWREPLCEKKNGCATRRLMTSR